MENTQSSSRNEPPKAGYAYDRQSDQLKHPPSLQKRVSASSLLSMFRARPSPSSVSQMERTKRLTRPVTYITLDDSDEEVQSPSVVASPGFAHSESSQESEASTGSNINVAAPSQAATPTGTPDQHTTTTPARSMPPRSTRSNLSYATPRREFASRKASTKKVKADPIVASDTVTDTTVATLKPVRVKQDTARNRAREEIATVTKAKRDAYLLHHKDLFLPLLPENNHISKLQPDNMRSIVAHQQLQSQPENVTAIMKPYQLKGLSFLATMYKNGMSAILGDEMGLGKTLQTLSLIQYLEDTYPSPSGIARPYLVVCPLSVLESWYNECRKWTPKLRPMRFHGSSSEREHLKQRAMGKVDRFGNETTQSKNKKSKRRASATPRKTGNEEAAGFDILITTYETFVSEKAWFKHAFIWRYIILDEGHKVKNPESNVSHALQSLNAEHRLLLTGTPIQNNLHEMWALLHWLFSDVFTNKTAEPFTNAFNLSKGHVSTAFMDDARRLLELVMLRRLKSSPGVNLGLPPKYEVLLYVPLTPIQRFWYTRLLTKAGGQLLDDLFTGVKDKEQAALIADEVAEKDFSRIESAAATVDQGGDQWAESREIIQQAIENDTAGETETNAYKRLVNLLMQLRKCCIHPYQIKGAAPDPYILGDHIMHASSKFLVLSKFVEELVIKQKKKILIFSGFTHVLDHCEDLLYYKGANQHNAPFRYLRLDGGSARAKRNLDIRLFNDASSEFRVFLISTKAGGLGLNLTAASEIIFLDEDWNPQVTLQAEARAHRIGQTSPVTIYKICTQGTVEEQMMGRIRKKLYLSAKVTESMRDIHSTPEPSRKRKRAQHEPAATSSDEMPQLGMSQLMSLVRRGATTLTHPEVDINEMLSWDFDTIIEKCKDRPVDPHVAEASGQDQARLDEKEWLAKMEHVETAVLNGVKYQRQVEAESTPVELTRSDRRVGKNTTVMVDGFAISKASLNCADWEAVPTMAGKDPRLASPKREKAPPIQHQDHCQVCYDGGEVVVCTSCPRVYHINCLSGGSKAKAESKYNFHCSQHVCFDCEKSTAEAGGLMYRCRWCEKGFCEDCLDWERAKLIGGTLPEYDMLEHKTKSGWYVECHQCVNNAESDAEISTWLSGQKKSIDKEYKAYLKALDKATSDDDTEAGASAAPSRDETMTNATTVESSGQTTPRGKGRRRLVPKQVKSSDGGNGFIRYQSGATVADPFFIEDDPSPKVGRFAVPQYHAPQYPAPQYPMPHPPKNGNDESEDSDAEAMRAAFGIIPPSSDDGDDGD